MDLITLKDITIGFGGPPLIDGASLIARPGDRLALVGRNGAGKSTLLRIMAGLTEPDSGEVRAAPRTRVVYLDQEPKARQGEDILDYATGDLSHPSARDLHRAGRLLAELSIDEAADMESLSGGEMRRVSLVRALVGEADVLLLDEPTNHLDLPAIEWLEAKLKAFPGALLVISHDRAFLEATTDACLWLDRGRLLRAKTPISGFEAWREETYRLEAESQRKLARHIQRETKWLREGLSARMKRNQGRLRRLTALREERSRWIGATGRARLKASAGKRSGNLVFQIRNIAKSYGDHVLIRDFSTIIRRRDRIGIIGPNGAGKTTLLKILLGDLEPDEGTIRRGSNITPLVIGQKREELGEEDTVRNILTGGRSDQVTVGGEPRNVISYMKDFLFDPSQIDTPVRILSGGERNRLLLAREFAKPSNLLVLDEPTNDLDMETLDLLAEVLSDYDGTVIIVSHDRSFLDNVVGSTIVFEGDGLVTEYAGGYADYLVQRGKADRPSKEAKKRQDKAPAKDPARTAKPRLSYKHQRALDILPGKITGLETEISALEEELADPGLFVRDQARFTEVCENLESLKSELEKSEEALLEVEILREA